MRNLIKADMQRILRKKSIWVALILMIAIVIGDIFYSISTSADKNLAFAVGASESFYFLGLVVGIILVLNVYADDTLVYSSDAVTGGVLPIDVKANVSGASKLTLEITYNQEQGFGDCIVVSDMSLYKEYTPL